jgi:hypothetical protein
MYCRADAHTGSVLFFSLLFFLLLVVKHLGNFDAAPTFSVPRSSPYQLTGKNASVASPATGRICGYDGGVDAGRFKRDPSKAGFVAEGQPIPIEV